MRRKLLKLLASVKWHRCIDSRQKLLPQCARNLSNSAAHGDPFASDLRPYRVTTHAEAHKQSLEDPESFWAEQADRITWFKKWDKVLDNSNPPFTKWFVGGELNICYNALDRHITSGLADRTAIVYDSPVTGIKKEITYGQLHEQVSLFAAVLARRGVERGDRVLIYMPMVPETVVAMLACARLGAIHIVVFGGFAAKELGVRINHSQPRVVVTASAGIEPNRVINYKPIVDEAIELSPSKPQSCVVYRRPGIGSVTMQPDRDFDWDDEMATVRPMTTCVSVAATDPLFIIHTSGTTGLPKGVVRPTGGYAVVLPWSLQNIYGMRPGETWWAASDFGWVVGHSYGCYGPLLAGLTTVLYEGKPVGTPDAGQFFRVLSENNVTNFFVAPTGLRAIHQADADVLLGKQYPLNKLRAIHAAGEHLDMETRQWSQRAFGVPVLDHWWQTESGWPICAPCIGYTDADLAPAKDVSGKPLPGWDVHVLDKDNREAPVGQLGRIFVRQPLPPGCLSTLWRNDDAFQQTYFSDCHGFYNTMDAGFRTADGQMAVMSRVDDIINVAGHRISGGAIEEAILEHQAVVDCAVVGVHDEIKGSVPLALCILRDDFSGDGDAVVNEVVELVRHDIGPVAALKNVLLVPKLPKTRSGKIARSTLAAMAASQPYKVPVTIEDASAYPAIRSVMQEHGYALNSADPE